MLELEKNGKIEVKAWGHSHNPYEKSAIPIPLVSFWKTIRGSIMEFSKRVGKSLRTLEHILIRVDIGRLTLSKCEYIQIKSMMERWNIDIGELCRYSIMSVIKAHD